MNFISVNYKGILPEDSNMLVYNTEYHAFY